MLNYAEGLVTLDKDNNWVPCLARDWRWINDQTIEFKLRRGVTFHNGEEFNAEAVRINWEAYRKMTNPRVVTLTNLPDEAEFKIVDKYLVRFALPKPDGLAFVKFMWFFQGAPAFFKEHEVPEKNWLYFPESGPWGTGPFKIVEGGVPYLKPTDRIVLEAYDDYWDPRYPKVKRVIFDNTLIRDSKEAMRLCRELEGAVDIVSHMRPLDTLKVAESPFAKVVKSKDVTHLGGLINQRKENSKWRDIRLRKALNYAINRDELLKYAAMGNAYGLGDFLPNGVYGHNPNLTLYTYDTDKARSLLEEAGHPEGFRLKIITNEAFKLETQIIGTMLERIGLKVNIEVLTTPGAYARRFFMPVIDKPPKEQDWDIVMWRWPNHFGHVGATYLSFGFTEVSDMRWIEYDPMYERMWKDMASTVQIDIQEEKVRQLVEYLYNCAYCMFLYSPLNLYATNKQVNFVPQRLMYLRLKETSMTENHWSIRGKKIRVIALDQQD
jgi:peptide/nickel transport system substrate-binding protein